MLPGLQQGQEKMSKSDPSSSIFMEDEEVGFPLLVGINNQGVILFKVLRKKVLTDLNPESCSDTPMIYVTGRSECENKEGILPP